MTKARKQTSTPDKSASSGQRARRNGIATREAILNAAEELFAEVGYAAATLRMLAGITETNIASISYHFGSKEALLRAIYERRMTAVNNERLRLLREYMDKLGEARPQIEEVLECFLGPVFRAQKSDGMGASFRRLSSRAALDATPEVRAVVTEFYQPAAVEFVSAFRHACPDIPRTEFARRMLFLYGTMIYTAADTGRVQKLPGLQFDSADVDSTLKCLVAFLASGFKAPPVMQDESVSEPAGAEVGDS